MKSPNPVNIFVQRMLLAFYVCCIYLKALQTNFIIEANTLIRLLQLFAMFSVKVHKQMREKTTLIVNGGKRVKEEL